MVSRSPAGPPFRKEKGMNLKDLNLKEILTSRHNVARATRLLNAAGEVLDSVFKAREGTALSQGLAVASAVGTVIDALVPEKPPHDQLLDMGYKPLQLGLGAFFCNLLQTSELEREQLQVDAALSLVLWKVRGEAAVAAIYRTDLYESGPYVLEGKRELAAAALRKVIWKEAPGLMLDKGRNGERGQGYMLQPLTDPGVYFGEPGIDWYVERLKRHEGETRSMLLVGATGVGKSTLGRLIASEVDGGRLVKVGARVIRHSAVTDLVEIAEFLEPDVLLLDDVSMIANNGYGPESGVDSQMLELMEALHGKARLVIATLMLEPEGSGRRATYRRRARRGGGDSGADYFEGMRPGRVDEVVRVKRPSPRVREKILVHYFGEEEGLAALGVTKKILKDMIARTEGLTGAYLKEVAHRIKVHGVRTYKGEIKNVLEAAPKPSRAGRANARGPVYMYRRPKPRKTVWEKRFEASQKDVELLQAKNESLSLKLGVEPAELPKPEEKKPARRRRRSPFALRNPKVKKKAKKAKKKKKPAKKKTKKKTKKR